MPPSKDGTSRQSDAPSDDRERTPLGHATNIVHGGCLCGTVLYEASGKPYNITHCHCTDCRRSSGAAFVTWASFRRADFRFTQGEPRELAWAGRLRSFCAQCGTPLTFMTGPEADEVDVTVCSFDRPDSVSPADHTWVEDRLRWIRPADGLPAYEQKRPDHAAKGNTNGAQSNFDSDG